ncbi:MAG: methyltransferase domain-containing protein [Bacteroidia bacterium]
MNQLPQAYFDNYALAYDDHFSGTPVGIAQRQMVHSYLKTICSPEKSVLEINCGTGVDAVFLSQKYMEVISTDISYKMVKLARVKTSYLNNCSVIESSIQNLNNALVKKSDLIFSNFGGLNCLNEKEMQNFSKDCLNISNKNSELVFVIMGKKCSWERFYFILKGDFEKAFRRNKREGVKIGTDEEEFIVYYYSPNEIKKLFSDYFEVKYRKPVGFFIPPSYMNSYFEKHPLLFSILNKLDKVFRDFSFLSNYSDHYLIHLKRR